MGITKSATRGVAVRLQDAATTGDGEQIALPSSFKNHTLYIKGGTGVSAGAIQPEVANLPEDADALWAPVGGGPVTIVADQTIAIQLTGVFGAIRARISTTVVNGTVTVDYVGG